MGKRIFIGAVALAVAFLVGLALYLQAPTSKKSVQQKAASPKAPIDTSYLVRWHSPAFGNKSSKVTVVEWFDPECEGCRAIHPIFDKIIADYSNRVHFVLRYMPFHSNSLYAASVLEEAREFGKFREALDIIFANQPEWGSHAKPRPELIPVYLQQLGIPKEKLERSYVISKHAAKIKMDEDDGLKVGVTGIPSFFVNGLPVVELGDEPLRTAINRALSQAK